MRKIAQAWPLLEHTLNIELILRRSTQFDVHIIQSSLTSLVQCTRIHTDVWFGCGSQMHEIQCSESSFLGKTFLFTKEDVIRFEVTRIQRTARQQTLRLVAVREGNVEHACSVFQWLRFLDISWYFLLNTGYYLIRFSSPSDMKRTSITWEKKHEVEQDNTGQKNQLPKSREKNLSAMADDPYSW